MSEDLGGRPALVRGMRQEADGVLSVQLEPLDGAPEPWEPGAHLDILLPTGGTRQYSLSGRPGQPGYRIAVLHEPDGRGGSHWVHRTLRVGDVVGIRGPRNHFALEQAPGYLFIAGGIGVTPLLPMIARLDAEGRPWSLAYAGRSRRNMAFLDELAAYGDRVAFAPRDEGGRLDADALVAGLAPGVLVYVCGPQRLLESVRAALAVVGAEDRLRAELFAAPKDDAVPGATDAFTVELRRSGLTLTVSSEQSILGAAGAARVDVMSDCEEGICGSCETRVLEGEPIHRDYVLTAQEKAQNDCMMICVSRSARPLLVLDL
jgi:ferredoxin-NADP reductase